MSACKHGACTGTAEKAGYCNAHYIRQRRGRPMDALIRRASDDPARFWQKVDKGSSCWEWTAFRGADGYGRFMVDRTPRLAHRVAFEDANGPIPDGMEIDHMCHNHGCVNPAHLRLATRSLNAQNMSGARVDSSTGIRGVRYRADTRRWTAVVQIDGQRHYLGGFATAHAAEAAVTAFRRENMPFSLMDREGA